MAFGRVNPPGLVYKIDLSKIADRENPRTVEAPIYGGIQEPTIIDWGDGTSDTVTTGSFPTHTYADGTGNVFVVTLRSATGHLPDLTLSQSDPYNSTSPNANVTLAVVSVDHFAGSEGSSSGNASAAQYKARFARNLKFCDTRFLSQTKWTSISMAFRSAGIEQGLDTFCFDFSTQIQGAEAVFLNCSGLTGSIPADLFRYNTSVTNFGSVFYGCIGLTGSIPADLFKYNTSATNFNSTFFGCSGLTGSIPADLFKYNTSVTTFSGTFRMCRGLTGSIPVGLFDSNISVSNISACFYSCLGLTSIPTDLFDNNNAITNANATFAYCSGLTGEPYKFWEKSYASTITNTADCYTGCPAALRAQVPAAYGGTMTVS